jgi:hypothetical protein
MMKCDDREVAMRLGQSEPCEHDALLKVGGKSLIRREIQIQRGVSRNWAGPGTGQVTSISTSHSSRRNASRCHSVMKYE